MEGCKILLAFTCVLVWMTGLFSSVYALQNGTHARFVMASDTAPGPLCYSCDMLTNPKTCGHSVRCSRDELCMLHELTPSLDGSKRYIAGCKAETVCESLRNHAKRAYVFCHNCCKQDLCNNHCGSTPTHSTTSQQTTTKATTSRVTTTVTTPKRTTKPVIPTTRATTAKPSTTTPKRTTKPVIPTTRATTAKPSTTTPKRTTKPVIPTTRATTAKPSTTTPKRTTKPVIPTTRATTAKPSTTTHHVEYPIMCFSCKNMVQPSACKHLVTCHVGHACMIQVTGRSVSGQNLYKSSCEPDLLCNAIGRSVSLIGKRDDPQNVTVGGTGHNVHRRYNTCTSCCRTHLCNNQCGSSNQNVAATTAVHRTTTEGISATPLHTTPSIVYKTTALQTTPATVYKTTALQTTPATVYKTIALQTTPATVFPIGKVCYKCDAMTQPNECHHLTRCAADEVCILYQTEDHLLGSGKLYHAGCSKQQVCDVFSSLPNLHDRYASTKFCHTCCTTHMCNNKCTYTTPAPTKLAQTTTPLSTLHLPSTTRSTLHLPSTTRSTLHLPSTTRSTLHLPSTTRSPNGERCKQHDFIFIPYISLCFKFETLTLSQNVAEHWCDQYGATLAILDNPGKFSVVQSLLKFEPHFANQVVYIGGVNRYGNHTFYWPDGSHMAVGSSSLNIHSTTQSCLSMDGTRGFGMQVVDCSQSRKFICTMDIS